MMSAARKPLKCDAANTLKKTSSARKLITAQKCSMHRWPVDKNTFKMAHVRTSVTLAHFPVPEQSQNHNGLPVWIHALRWGLV